MKYAIIDDKRIWYKKGENFCATHFHRAIEILYVVSGEKQISVNNRDYTLTKGNIFFCPPWCTHCYKKSNNSEQICIVAPSEYCINYEKLFINNTPSSMLIKDTDNFFLSHIQKLQHPQNYIQYEGILNFILGEYLSKITLEPKKRDQLENLQEKIVEYVNENYKNNITLTDIATYFGYTKNHFSALFKKKFSITFIQYLNFVRIKESLPLLKTVQTTAIHLYCGFNSAQQYFSNFKKFLHCTPQEYVKNKSNSMLNITYLI